MYICLYKIYTMSYKENHLREWLINHKCINISCLEKQCNIKAKNLAFFKSEQRRIGIDEYNTVTKHLLNYGYIPLNDE